METRRLIRLVTMLCIAALILAGCASVPKKSAETSQAIFQQPIKKTREAAVNALVVLGFDIKKQEDFYIEGFRPRKVGLFVGSGGETVGIWLESLTPDRTRVLVATAKSFVGIVGQKNWDDEVLAELRKSLGNKE